MNARSLLLALVLLIVPMAGCFGDSDEIVIGSLMPLTGPAATLGAPTLRGAEMAVDEINAAGGIDGKQIRLVSGDTQFPSTEEAVKQYRRIAGEGAQVIIGALASDSTAAVKPLADEDHVVLISPSSTRPSLTGPDHGYFYRTIANDDVQGPQAASILKETLGASSAVVMFQQTGYAEGLKNVFVPAFEALGGAVDGEPISWTDDEGTMSSKAIEAAAREPEYVWISGQAPEMGSLIRELRNAGYDGDILTSEALEGQGIFDVASAEVDGVYFTKSSPDTAGSAYTAWLADYRAKFGEAPGPFDVYAYDAVYVAAAAIEAVGNNGEDIRAWLETHSVSGRITTPTIAFFEGDVTTGGYVLFRVDSATKSFVPA